MSGKRFFLNVCAGKFSEVVDPGETRHEFDEITGRLLHIQFKDTKAGETMRLYVVDANNLFILSMFVYSLPANAFFYTVRNLNFQSELTFKINRVFDRKTGKEKDRFTIHQFGNSVRWSFDAANQHLLPVDNFKRKEFLKGIVITETIPALQKIVNPFPYHSIYKPLGSGNGLQGGYFKNDNTRTAKAISDEEVKEAGYKTRSEYIQQSRRL